MKFFLSASLVCFAASVTFCHSNRKEKTNAVRFLVPHSHSKIHYLVRSGAKNSADRQAAIHDTWGSSVDANAITILPSNQECESQYGNNHGFGLTCLEAKAEKQLASRPDFDWLMVIDDDVYVHTQNLQASVDALPKTDNAVWGIPGCGKCPPGAGLCGGGGYLIHRDQFRQMFASASVVNEFMSEPDMEWCDVRFACVAQAHGLALNNLKGLYGWSFEKPTDEDAAIRSTDVPPLTFHYSDPARMRRLHEQFSAPQSSLAEDEGGYLVTADMYEDQVRAYINQTNALQSTRRH